MEGGGTSGGADDKQVNLGFTTLFTLKKIYSEVKQVSFHLCLIHTQKTPNTETTEVLSRSELLLSYKVTQG